MSATSASYAPVDDFMPTVVGHSIVGYAAPRSGPRPAAVALYSGDTLVHVAGASRFSAQAHDDGKRLGWCGFILPGAAQAFALSPQAILRCHATGRELSRLDRSMLAAPPAADAGRLDIFGLMAAVRLQTDATEVAQIQPFVEAHYRLHGASAAVDAGYRMLLGREPDPSGREDWLQNDRHGSIVGHLFTTIVQSEEYRSNRRRHIPGPFHPDFRLTLEPLL